MKKTTIIIAVLLVTASLSIGINIGLTWNKTTPTSTPSPTPTGTIPITPTSTPPVISPMPTSSATIVNISYSEVSRTETNGTTKLVISVNSELVSGVSANFDYSKFILDVFVPRGGLLPSYIGMKYASAVSLTSGFETLTIDDETASLNLSFEFPTMGENFDDNVLHFSSYQLQYSDTSPIIQWADR